MVSTMPNRCLPYAYNICISELTLNSRNMLLYLCSIAQSCIFLEEGLYNVRKIGKSPIVRQQLVKSLYFHYSVGFRLCQG